MADEEAEACGFVIAEALEKIVDGSGEFSEGDGDGAVGDGGGEGCRGGAGRVSLGSSGAWEAGLKHLSVRV